VLVLSSWYSREISRAIARGRLPVDLAQAVADPVVAHLVEVGAFAAAALQVRADQRARPVRR
jgi:hypothetical protein